MSSERYRLDVTAFPGARRVRDSFTSDMALGWDSKGCFSRQKGLPLLRKKRIEPDSAGERTTETQARGRDVPRE